uniref:Uncharacterized protein n=1 Tax=Arundo donax TaxID=35708 RepID=A0A0A9GTS4_ARUDO
MKIAMFLQCRSRTSNCSTFDVSGESDWPL